MVCYINVNKSILASTACLCFNLAERLLQFLCVSLKNSLHAATGSLLVNPNLDVLL